MVRFGYISFLYFITQNRKILHPHHNGVCLRLILGLHLVQHPTFGYREHLIASILT